jgi:hypothetical protein
MQQWAPGALALRQDRAQAQAQAHAARLRWRVFVRAALQQQLHAIQVSSVRYHVQRRDVLQADTAALSRRQGVPGWRPVRKPRGARGRTVFE